MRANRMRTAISRVTAVPAARAVPRAPIGQQRKIAILGGASTIRFAPFNDLSWELWSHASCRDRCRREPDVFFDLHPPELWRDPVKKKWDPGYLKWLTRNHVPIYMQDRYEDVPASIRYPFEQMITEFPRGYMTNSAVYMVALALMQGATHLGIFGCHYQAKSEYAAQRGSMEYWLGVAEGRGVHVLIPPTCDLLNRPSLLYGYQSHPNGKRDPSYTADVIVPVGAKEAVAAEPITKDDGDTVKLFSLDDPKCPPLVQIDIEPPALERANGLPVSVQ